MKAPNEPEEIQPDKPTDDPPARDSLAGFRLQKHADFQRAYAAGRKRQSASMSWFLAPQPSRENAAGQNDSEQKARPSAARVGLTAGKVLGKAHERNRIKRRMRAAIIANLDALHADVDVVLHPKRAVLTASWNDLRNEVRRIFVKISEGREQQQSPRRGSK